MSLISVYKNNSKIIRVVPIIGFSPEEIKGMEEFAHHPPTLSRLPSAIGDISIDL
jgi:hypothetical protein